MAADYPILGAPSIDLEQFTGILRSAGSPAAGEAAGIYAAALRYHVDPAVLLATFQHESSFGKAGIARGTKSIGNLRYTAASAPYGSRGAAGFTAYPSWTLGAADASRLLASSLYGGSRGYSSALTFPARWAPASDGNSPIQYGRALVNAINGWTGATSAGNAPSSPAPARQVAPAGPQITPGMSTRDRAKVYVVRLTEAAKHGPLNALQRSELAHYTAVAKGPTVAAATPQAAPPAAPQVTPAPTPLPLPAVTLPATAPAARAELLLGGVAVLAALVYYLEH